jgi:hypothetical protein
VLCESNIRLRVLTVTTSTILTLSSTTPPAIATACLNASRFSIVKSLSVKGKTRTSFKNVSVGKPENGESSNEHVDCPGLVLNFPATQSVQTVDAATAAYLPAAQSEQVLAVLAPTVAEYLPAPQGVQSTSLV